MIKEMEAAPVLQETHCAICGPEIRADEVFPSTITPEAFDAQHFSARRLPDRIHYRMVRCSRCMLVRSDPAADPAQVAGLYARSSFDYDSEVPNLRRTYGRYLKELDKLGAKHDVLLEVGCGNGFFLEEALRLGYKEVLGIEPSRDAIEAAPDSVRGKIVEDVLHFGVFRQRTADVVCMFQVFDHLPDPVAALDEVHRMLKLGGLALILNHDIDAPSAKLLGEKSPIVDVEHYYLYSRATLGWLAKDHGFEVLKSGSVWNDYSLAYVSRLLPLPAGMKRGVQRFLEWARLAKVNVRVPLGNLYVVLKRV